MLLQQVMIYLASSAAVLLLVATAAGNAAFVVGSSIPVEWQSAVNNADMFYTDDDANVDRNNMPMIGNGMVALQIGNDEMYIAGVFNNYTHYSTSSHRAVIPTGLAAIAVKPPGISSDAALDVRNARYLRRSYIDPSSSSSSLSSLPSSSSCTSSSVASCTNSIDRIVVEQRFYAHRSIPSVLVMEVCYGNGCIRMRSYYWHICMHGLQKYLFIYIQYCNFEWILIFVFYIVITWLLISCYY